MSERIAWLNGAFVAEQDARVSIFDRGLLFGDGVYDVATVLQGGLLDADYHLARLARSCAAIGLADVPPAAHWLTMMHELLQRTGVTEGLVYLQVTRGVAERDFAFPVGVQPTLFAYARSKPLLNDPNVGGVAVVTTPDLRWARRDIKSTSLLAQVLAKQYAREQGVYEVFMHADGVITEGGSSNAFLVKNRTVITQPLTTRILAGVTRHVILDLAAAAEYGVEERGFTVAEAHAADELFLSSATSFVLPVTRLDETLVADGKPGVVTQRLRALYIERALAMVSKDAGGGRSAHVR